MHCILFKLPTYSIYTPDGRGHSTCHWSPDTFQILGHVILFTHTYILYAYTRTHVKAFIQYICMHAPGFERLYGLIHTMHENVTVTCDLLFLVYVMKKRE